MATCSQSIVKKIENAFKRFEALKNTNTSILIYGSVLTKDFVPWLSDINIMVVSKRDLDFKYLLKLRRVVEHLKKEISNQITFRVYTYDDVLKKKFLGFTDCIALKTYLVNSRIIYGTSKVMNLFKQAIENSTIMEVYNSIKNRVEKSLCTVKSMISTVCKDQPLEFNLYGLKHSSESWLKYALLKISDIVLKCVTYYLILEGYFEISKKNMVFLSKKFFKADYFKVILQSLEIRENPDLALYHSEKLSYKFIKHAYALLLKIRDNVSERFVFNRINNAFEGLLFNDSVLRYRKNVGAIIRDDKGRFLIVEKDNNEWQFVQGGVNEGETDEQALFRELKEELGVSKENYTIKNLNIKNTYDWPINLQKKKKFKGQSQNYYEVIIPNLCLAHININEKELKSYKIVPKNKVLEFIQRQDLIEVFNKYLELRK